MAEADDEAAPRVEAGKEKSKRRAAELDALRANHAAHVRWAHETHPTPRGVKFGKMTDAERQRYVEKRKVIDAANRDYHKRVRATCARHRAEEPGHEAGVVAGRAALRAARAKRRSTR